MRKIFLTSSILSMFLLGAALLVSPIGCKSSDSEKKQGSTEEAKVESKAQLESSTLRFFPEGTLGFLYWEREHAAYGKFQTSKWQESGAISKMAVSGATRSAFVEALKQASVDVENPATWQPLMQKMAIGLAPGVGTDLRMAVVAESKDGDSYSKVVPAFLTALKAKGEQVEPVQVAKGSLSKLTVKQTQDSTTAPQVAGSQTPERTQELYLGFRDSRLVLSIEKTFAEEILASEGEKLPASLSSSAVSDALAELSGPDTRFLTGFMDLQTLMAKMPAPTAQEAALSPVGVKSLVFGSFMDKTPSTELRVLYDAASKNEWISAIANSSNEKLSALAPQKPLLFLSFDGKTLKNFKDIALKTDPQMAAGMEQPLSLVDSIQRLGILVKVAPVGQAILPVPDVTVLVQSSKPTESMQTLKQLLSMASSMAPATAGQQWKSEQIDGVATESMVTPFGVGAFLAAIGDTVVVSSTANQLKTLIATNQNKSPALSGELKGVAKSMVAQDETYMSFLMDFSELGSLIENMGGLLAMYAPQDAGNSSMMEPAEIQRIKQMGVLTASVKSEPGKIKLDSTYVE